MKCPHCESEMIQRSSADHQNDEWYIWGECPECGYQED